MAIDHSFVARRRLLLGGLAAGLSMAGATLPDIAFAQGTIAVVSRDRILRESAASARLREAEAAMTDQLQRQIEATKAQLAAEEEELARLRGELPDDQFEARIADFDARVRQARRGAQERAAQLQKGFQEARAVIAAALPALMEQLRTESGVAAVLNADQVLALDPALDLTDRAIALLDSAGPAPLPPDVDLATPLFAPAAEQGQDAGSAPADAPPAETGAQAPEASLPGR